MKTKTKKTKAVETQAPAEGEIITPTPEPTPEPVKLTNAQIIANANVETKEQREALRKAVSETRADLFATTTEDAQGVSRSNVRYNNGRAMKQRPNEPEAVLFANSRRLMLGLLETVEELTAAATDIGLKRDAAQDEAKAYKAELAVTVAELAVVKAELEKEREPGGNTASGLPAEEVESAPATA